MFPEGIYLSMTSLGSTDFPVKNSPLYTCSPRGDNLRHRRSIAARATVLAGRLCLGRTSSRSVPQHGPPLPRYMSVMASPVWYASPPCLQHVITPSLLHPPPSPPPPAHQSKPLGERVDPLQLFIKQEYIGKGVFNLETSIQGVGHVMYSRPTYDLP